MHPRKLHGKRVLILGLGREGGSTLRYLAAHCPKAVLGVADQKEHAALNDETQCLLQYIPAERRHLGGGYLKALGHYEVIVKAPGITPRIPEITAATMAGVRITSATSMFLALTQGRVVGVTGTKGKSTTAAMIAAILKQAGFDTELIGNIGRPALDSLRDNDGDRTYIYELSSYQLEDLRGFINVGVLLNLFPEHLDYHGGKEVYYNAKLKLLAAAREAVVYDASQQEIALAAEALPCARLPIEDEHNGIRHGFLSTEGKPLMAVSELAVKGAHNHFNALCAARTASWLGAERRVTAQALKAFRPLPHRLESLGVFRGIEFIDDVLATTPQSTIAALRAIPAGVATLILGGRDRGYDFSELAEEILISDIQTVLLFPGSGKRIWKAVAEAAERPVSRAAPRHFHVSSMEECVRHCFEHTSPDSICLLSCASPSYGLFRDYEDKAAQFREWITRLS